MYLISHSLFFSGAETALWSSPNLKRNFIPSAKARAGSLLSLVVGGLKLCSGFGRQQTNAHEKVNFGSPNLCAKSLKAQCLTSACSRRAGTFPRAFLLALLHQQPHAVDDLPAHAPHRRQRVLRQLQPVRVEGAPRHAVALRRLELLQHPELELSCMTFFLIFRSQLSWTYSST